MASLVGPAGSGNVASPAVSSSLAADPITSFIRIFVGNGTADNPNAGILFGNGYSYTSDGGAAPVVRATAATAA